MAGSSDRGVTRYPDRREDFLSSGSGEESTAAVDADQQARSHSRRCDRLRSSADFSRVRTEGRSWSSPLLVIQAAPNRLDTIRIGVIVSKRLGKAVRRNRIRRLIREAARVLCQRLRGGWDLVIIARSRMAEATFAEVQAALEEVLTRARLLDGPPVATESPTGGFPFATEEF